MHFSQEQLLEYLATHHLSYTLYTHAPLFTCEQGLKIVEELKIPGTVVKNLFLKDDKKNVHLIVAASSTHVDLKTVGKVLELKGLRFADATLLMNHLGVEPGSVTPLALINDKTGVVNVIIDATLLKQEYLQIHPLKNSATVVITPTDLLQFLSLINRSYLVYDFVNNDINV